MDSQTTLSEVINKLVEEKTFTASALEGINELKLRAKSLEAENTSLKSKAERIQSDLELIRKKKDELCSDVEILKDALAKANKEVERLLPSGYEAQKQAAIASAYKNAMEIVFKPASVRRTVQERIPIAMSNPGGGSFVQEYTGSISTIESEE